jgi:diguanylate cyclase
VLAARDRRYGIAEGRLFSGDELPVGALIQGRGPRVAPAVAEIAAYAAAPASRALPIGALAGAPILRNGGELLGCLCGLGPVATGPELARELPTIELLARLLGALLSQELDRQALQRRFERAELDAHTDPLTGVGNRRAWDRLLDAEEARCARYGSPASLLAVDLDQLKRVNDSRGHAAGDALLRQAAQVIQASKRAADVVARLGGDEFGVLAVECDEGAAAVLAERLRRALAAAGIRASVGHATRRAAGLAGAWAEADAAMYASKRRA